MKKQCYFFVTALLLCFSTIGKANGEVEFVAEVSGSNSFILKLHNPEQATIQVSLKDREGSSFHEAVYLQSSIQHQYNLKNLPVGEYVLIVQYNDHIAMQPLTKRSHVLEIDNDKLETILPPEIDFSAGYLDIKMSCPEDLSVYIKFQDDLDHVLYRQNQKAKGQIQKRFNLKRLESGRYHFSMHLESDLVNRSYWKSISLNAEQ